MKKDSHLHYFSPDWIIQDKRQLETDLCIYGGTAAGVIAACTAAAEGLDVILLNPAQHLGGMTSGGLGWTDFGNKHVIGGRARQFYRDLGQAYGKNEEWQFEPHVAETIFKRYVDEARIHLYHRHFLAEVELQNGTIQEVALLGGLRVRAKYYIDATYEGDLMAAAGISHTIGREANSVYGETLNGIQVRDKHQFSHPVSPYLIADSPDSGLLPFIEAEDLVSRTGEGDRRIQAYNFRVCMTDDPSLKRPWPQPDDYNPLWYELARRWFNSPKDDYNEQLDPNRPLVPRKFDIFPHKTPDGYHKTDTNNHGPVSSDFIGGNWCWPEATYEEREKIFQRHVSWQQGFYWTMANDPAIPERYRKAYNHWGLATDEFTDTENWPHQLYVREARRMLADCVITEHHTMGRQREDDVVGMASYTCDSHNCTRFIHENRVLNEGDVQIPPTAPYGISWRSIIPRTGECGNLAVPVCLSASHIAYGSIRMEPVFMVLAESAALGISIAIRNGVDLHAVPYRKLRSKLEDASQILELPR
ncbi:MAG: FAD-dependent oxidoreductase [Lentisphaerae bacterium]|nr:MAG: FAD-dependent oxidoreductase [Lentisphaerota bacterium]